LLRKCTGDWLLATGDCQLPTADWRLATVDRLHKISTFMPMLDNANHLKDVIAKTYPFLEAISDADAAIKPGAGKWSKKEIIGHLIDSACNNHQKFVRTMISEKVDFTGYQQDDWVKIQQYQTGSWKVLLLFWKLYNLQLADLIEGVDPGRLQNKITIDGKGPFTLEFIMKDYVEHLKHHLKQVLPGAEFLESQFKNIY
jgi:DinB superfamily